MYVNAKTIINYNEFVCNEICTDGAADDMYLTKSLIYRIWQDILAQSTFVFGIQNWTILFRISYKRVDFSFTDFS